MARDFVTVSEETLSTTTVPISGPPFSISLWFNAPFNFGEVLFGLADNSVADNWFKLFIASGAGQESTFQRNDGTTLSSVNVDGTNPWVINVWNHVLLISDATDHAMIWMNGKNTFDPADADVDPTGLDRFSIGGILDSTPEYAKAKICEAAVWGVSLSNTSRDMLAAGYSPLFVQPEGLISYWPIVGRADPEIDLVGGNHLTVNATPLAFPHIPIYMPSQQILQFPAAADTTLVAQGTALALAGGAATLASAGPPRKYMRQHRGFYRG